MVLSIGRESFVWAVGGLCAFQHVPFDADAYERPSVNAIHPTAFPALTKLKPIELQITQAEHIQETQPNVLPNQKYNKKKRLKHLTSNGLLNCLNTKTTGVIFFPPHSQYK